MATAVFGQLIRYDGNTIRPPRSSSRNISATWLGVKGGFQELSLEWFFDDAAGIAMNMEGARVRARCNDVGDVIADKVQSRAVVERITGRHGALLDQRMI